MQKVYKKIFLICLPPFLVLFFAEMNLRNIKTVYEIKKAGFEKAIPNIDLLIFGNSHGENGIIPAMLSNNGYNLSMPSQSIYYNEKILEKYLPELKNLKTVIITVDYHSFFFTDQELSAFNNDKTFGVSKPLYNYRFTGENLSYFFFVYGALPSINLLINKPKSSVFEQGYEPMLSGDSSKINSHSGFKRAASHNKLAITNHKLKQNLVESFVKMISLLRQHNIKTILISTPVYNTYSGWLDKNILKENQITTDSIANLYHIPYGNFMNDNRFIISDFSDNDHLSKTGAIKFSLLVKELLEKEK